MDKDLEFAIATMVAYGEAFDQAGAKDLANICDRVASSVIREPPTAKARGLLAFG